MISVLTNICGPAKPWANAGSLASRLAPASEASTVGRGMAGRLPDMNRDAGPLSGAGVRNPNSDQDGGPRGWAAATRRAGGARG